MKFQAFSMVPNRAVFDDSLGHSTFRVLCLLATYRNSQTGWCKPSLATLARQMGLSETSGETQVSRAVKELREKGYINHISGGGRGQSRYQVILDIADSGDWEEDETPPENDNPPLLKNDKGALLKNDNPPLSENNKAPPVKNNKGTILYNQNLSEGDISAAFDLFYAAYPRHEARGQAERAYRTAIKIAAPEVIMAGLQRQLPVMRQKEAKYRRLAATWLNGKGWLDEAPPEDAGDLTEKAMRSWF